MITLGAFPAGCTGWLPWWHQHWVHHLYRLEPVWRQPENYYMEWPACVPSLAGPLSLQYTGKFRVVQTGRFPQGCDSHQEVSVLFGLASLQIPRYSFSWFFWDFCSGISPQSPCCSLWQVFSCQEIGMALGSWAVADALDKRWISFIRLRLCSPCAGSTGNWVQAEGWRDLR